MKKCEEEEKVRKEKEAEKAPRTDIKIDHFEGGGEDFNEMMAEK